MFNVMKLGINTVLFKAFDVKTALKAIKLAGYDGAELSAIQGMCEHLVRQDGRRGNLQNLH